MCALNIKACKHFLVDPRNKSTDIQYFHRLTEQAAAIQILIIVIKTLMRDSNYYLFKSSQLYLSSPI